MHPGYGFLAENADFAQAVLDAGLTWIGPPPPAIRASATRCRPGTSRSRSAHRWCRGRRSGVGVDEVVAFAERYGLPVAIKAAFGGGGRGLKVARSLAEVPELYASAVREAVAAFGRGECFVERYLDRPAARRDAVPRRPARERRRGVDAGLLTPAATPEAGGGGAGAHSSEEQQAQLGRRPATSSAPAGYVGAGTCEFLVGQDGTISFLEVNTRLQVEHPVTEEVTGIDLVREMFRIADGEPLGYDDPARTRALDRVPDQRRGSGRGFLPAPGALTVWRPPSGPGVRVDAGVEPATTA